MAGDTGQVHRGMDLLDRSLEDRSMDIAEILDFSNREPLLNQCRFGLRNIVGTAPLKGRFKLGFDIFERSALMNLAQNILEILFAHFTVIDMLAHNDTASYQLMHHFTNA